MSLKEYVPTCTGCGQGCDLRRPGCFNGKIYAEELGIVTYDEKDEKPQDKKEENKKQNY